MLARTFTSGFGYIGFMNSCRSGNMVNLSFWSIAFISRPKLQSFYQNKFSVERKSVPIRQFSHSATLIKSIISTQSELKF